MSDIILTDKNFQYLKAFVLKRIGIHLTDFKKELIVSRLGRRMRLLKISTLDDYIELIKNNTEEATEALSCIATHHTYFNRESHHFELLRTVILPDLMHRLRGANEIRVWVAGCSEGAEAYDIAMLLDSQHLLSARTKVSILATDFDPALIARAQQGRFEPSMLKYLSPETIGKYFTHDPVTSDYQISSRCRALVDFKVSNLISEWPTGTFDIIFCRNVMIYFDSKIQVQLLSKFNGSLPSGGYLILGHAENLHMFAATYEMIGKTVYKKI